MLTFDEATILLTELLIKLLFNEVDTHTHIPFKVSTQFVTKLTNLTGQLRIIRDKNKGIVPQSIDIKSEYLQFYDDFATLIHILASLSTGKPGYFKQLRCNIIISSSDMQNDLNKLVYKYDDPPLINIIESIPIYSPEDMDWHFTSTNQIIGMADTAPQEQFIYVYDCDRPIFERKIQSIFSVTKTLLHNNLFITATSMGNISVWNIQTRQFMFKLQGHRSAMNTLQSLDQNRIISGGDNEFLIIWNLQTQSVETRINTGVQINKIVVLSHDRVCVISKLYTMIIFDVDSQQILFSYDNISEVIYTRELIIAGQVNGNILIINKDYKVFERIGLSTEIIEQIKVLPNKIIIVSKNNIEIFDLIDNKNNIYIKDIDIGHIDILPTGKIIGGTNNLKVWDLVTGHCEFIFNVKDKIMGVRYLADKDAILILTTHAAQFIT